MELAQSYYWLIQSERRKAILANLDQPMTASQIARRTGINLDCCLHLLWAMSLYGLLFSLNPDTQYNRLHWLTKTGHICQRRLRQTAGLPPLAGGLPDLPWDLFSSLCYSHRTAVVKAMQGQMQAAAIRRRAVFQDPSLRMSANNVRDVLRYLLASGVVIKVALEGKRYPHYELTPLGRAFQDLLVAARMFRARPEVA